MSFLLFSSLLVISYFLLLVPFTNSSVIVATLFFFLTGYSTIMCHMYISDFTPYVLYLVYVGGLLVLLIYMVIVSTNYNVPVINRAVLTMFFIATTAAILSFSWWYLFNFNWPFNKSFTSNSTLYFDPLMLFLLVTFLLYVFLNLSTGLRLGGRSLTLGEELARSRTY